MLTSRLGQLPPADTEHPQLDGLEHPNQMGGIFFKVPKYNGEIHKATIIDAIEDHNYQIERHPRHLKFRCSMNNDKYEDILTY